MNDTKWEELRLAMYSISPGAPQWRTKDLPTGYVSHWDSEWFYHFRDGGYDTIEWVEIKAHNEQQAAIIHSMLVRLHVPLRHSGLIFKVFGFIAPGEFVDYAD